MTATLLGSVSPMCLACGPSLEIMIGAYAIIVGLPSMGLVGIAFACSRTSWEHGRALGRSLGRIGLAITLTLDLLALFGAGLATAGAPATRWEDLFMAVPFIGILSVMPLTCSAIAIRMNRPPQEPAYPACRGCGYNLTGLIEPRCPECGRGFNQASNSIVIMTDKVKS